MEEVKMDRDTVFNMLMEDPDNRLNIYNAINKSNYIDPSAVEYTYLCGGIRLSVRDDYSYVIDGNLNYFITDENDEEQHKYRSLEYFKKYLFKEAKVNSVIKNTRYCEEIPRFIILYNGNDNMPFIENKNLLDESEEEIYEMNKTCTIYNISDKRNFVFLEKCSFYREYNYLVEYIKLFYAKQGNTDIEAAIEEAIKHCIRNNILKDFLLEKGSEVMLILNRNYQLYKQIKKDAIRNYENGLKVGIEVGIKECNENFMKKMLAKGYSEEEISDILKL